MLLLWAVLLLQTRAAPSAAVRHVPIGPAAIDRGVREDAREERACGRLCSLGCASVALGGCACRSVIVY